MPTNHHPQNDYGWSDEKNWKGLFYFNRRDKRIFPPKPTGTGFTINFANLWSIICAILIAAVLPVLFFLFR